MFPLGKLSKGYIGFLFYFLQMRVNKKNSNKKFNLKIYLKLVVIVSKDKLN